MITLITGTPGAGKTLYAVAELLGGEYAGRPLYVDGIPELLLDHEIAQDPLDWQDWIPQGKDAVLVVDECQRVWRPRHYGKEVPPSVSAMETHRHMGVDVVLITQHPNLLDSNVRRLVGRHIHVRRLWGMSRTMVYEWDGATDPQRTSTAIARQWKYPKKAFNWYKSATAHTARKQRMPASIWLFAIAFLGVPICAYLGYQTFFSRFSADDTVTAAIAPALGDANGLPVAPPAPGKLEPVEKEFNALDLIPRDQRFAYSAPVYDHLTEVVAFPKLRACIHMPEKDTCTCYSQQGTDLQVPHSTCIDHLERWPFDNHLPDAHTGPQFAL